MDNVHTHARTHAEDVQHFHRSIGVMELTEVAALPPPLTPRKPKILYVLMFDWTPRSAAETMGVAKCIAKHPDIQKCAVSGSAPHVLVAAVSQYPCET